MIHRELHHLAGSRSSITVIIKDLARAT